jgi:hypothetical protein
MRASPLNDVRELNECRSVDQVLQATPILFQAGFPAATSVSQHVMTGTTLCPSDRKGQ